MRVNGYAYSINNRGEVAGLAENGKKDPNPACPVSQFEPVIWKNGQIHELQTAAGDTDGVAAAINDYGQVSGASGTCASSFNGHSGLYLVEDHVMLWDSDGTPHDFGNLGGSGGIAGNHACALNNLGQVVGHSELTNNLTFHGFLWTRETGMKDLGTLSAPFDYASLALGINDRGDVVGAALDASLLPTAVLWEKGASMPANLNGLVVGNPSGLTLLVAESINTSGEIVGLAVTSNFEAHGFLAKPMN
jgi:probable HAF family extracellular repeat protein